MRVVVVETPAVAEREVALNFGEGQFAMRVLLDVARLVRILPQLLHVEAARVRVRVLARVIPAHSHARLDRAAHERDGLGDDIELLRTVARDAVFGLDAEENEWRVQGGSRGLDTILRLACQIQRLQALPEAS